MKISLLLKEKPIGYIEYEVLNTPELMGILGPIYTNPPQLAAALTQKIKNNRSITVSGGFKPKDLSSYFDGVVLVLESLKESVEGFDYRIPQEENPYLEDGPRDEGVVH